MVDSGKAYYRTDHKLRRLGGDEHEFIVLDFEFEEQLNESYRLTVRCKIPDSRHEPMAQGAAARHHADVEFLLQRRFPDGELLETRICGLVESIERCGEGDGERGWTNDLYTITVRPAWDLLKTDKTGSTWHDHRYDEIVIEQLTQGLAKFGRTVRPRLRRDYLEVDFTVRRPDESLYDFCQKLMRRVGINYYFDHEAGVEVMVLVDDNEQFVPGNRRSAKPFAAQWFESNPTDDEEQITRAHKRLPTTPKAQSFKGFDIEQPNASLELPLDVFPLDVGVDLGRGGETVVHERLRPNERNPEEHVEQRARLETEVVANRTCEYDFETTITGTLAGRSYEVEINPGDVRTMVATKVSARGTRLDAPPADYGNRASFMPTTDEAGQPVPIRPIKDVDEGNHFGLYRCTIVAIENDPVDVDGYLRCRVEFPWDERRGEAKPTYFSVLQPMGGTHQGTQWFPRAGDHALVTFIGGQHEQPVIVGCLYDKQHLPPQMGPELLVLPESRSWLGWTHCSIGDKSRMTMMNVKLDAGDELVFWSAPHDWLERVGHDSTTEIAHDETRTIGHDLEQTVEHDHRERVERDYSLTVAGDSTLTMSGARTCTVSGAARDTFESGLTQAVEGGARETVRTGSRSFTVPMGDFSVTSGRTIKLAAPRLSLAVASAGFGGAGKAMGGQLDITSRAHLKAPVSAMLEGADSQVIADGKGVHLDGPATHITDAMGGSARLDGGKYVVDAPQGIEFRCGANILRLAPGGLYLNGTRLDIETKKTELRTTAFDIIGPEPGGDGVR